MCFDICTINIRVSIRVRGLHLVVFGHLLSHGFVIFLSLFCRFLVVFYLIALFFRVFCQFPPSLQLGGRCPIFGFPASMFEFCCSPFAACTVTFFPFSWLRHSFLPFFCGSVIVSCASVTSCFLCGAVLFFYVYLLMMVMWGFIFAKSSHQQRKHRSSQSIWKWVYLHTPLWKWKRLIPARSKASLKTCNCKSPCFDKTPNALGPSTKPLWQP